MATVISVPFTTQNCQCFLITAYNYRTDVKIGFVFCLHCTWRRHIRLHLVCNLEEYCFTVLDLRFTWRSPAGCKVLKPDRTVQYKRFGGAGHLHLRGETLLYLDRRVAADFSEMLVII